MKQFLWFMPVLLLGIASPAFAGECFEHDRLATILNKKFSEYQIGSGVAGKHTAVEIFVSEAGTFSIVATDTEHRSCIVGAGDGWQIKALDKQGDPT